MVKIEIPFLERFREPMLNGEKTATSRTKKYGEAGDTFDVFGGTFEIITVKYTPLDFVKLYRWKEEGAKSPEEFVEIWKQIHPKKGFDPEQYILYHSFRRVK